MSEMKAMEIYPDAQALQDKIEEYFDWCFTFEVKDGRRVPKVLTPPTFSGLARYLGFGSRAALLRYTNKENVMFEDIMNDAKLRIEDFYEGRLVMSRGPSTGIQFALKNNCGWEDMSKQQLSGPENKPLMFSWGVEEAQVVQDAQIAALDSSTKQLETPIQTSVDEQTVPVETKDAPTYEGEGIPTMGDMKFE